jgi:hypothetical protein
MKMFCCLAFSFFPLASSGVFADETETAVKRALRDLEAAVNKKEADECVRHFHPDSPSRDRALSEYKKTFATFDFKYEIEKMSYIGADDQVAVITFTDKTTIEKVQGKGDRKGEIARTGLLMVFRKHQGEWKIWSSLDLPVLVDKK